MVAGILIEILLYKCYTIKEQMFLYERGINMEQKIDVLNREPFIDKLIEIVELLSKDKKGCCFGINGAWGSGKSFVLEKFEEQLKNIQLEETADNKYFVFHYDCWKYDYYDEPSIAIVSAMLESNEEELRFFSKEQSKAMTLSLETVRSTLKAIAGELCKNKIGIDLVEIAGDVLKEHDKSKEESFDSLYGFKRALDKAREGIQEIAKDKTVIIVVDELDRCLPEYAIKVLERLHHIFVDIDNVIVIISMDKKQLEHSIKGIYGNIAVDEYLRKFISFKADLNNGKVSSYAEKYKTYFDMFSIPEEDLDIIEQFLGNILVNMPMRTQEGIFRKAEIIHNIIKSNEIENCGFMTFEILFLTLAYKTKSNDLKWLGEIPRPTSPEIQDILGINYYAMLDKWLNEVTVGVFQSSPKKSRKHLRGPVGKAFFLVSTVNNDKAGNIKSDYYYCDAITDEMINSVKKFSELVDIIDSD